LAYGQEEGWFSRQLDGNHQEVWISFILGKKDLCITCGGLV